MKNKNRKLQKTLITILIIEVVLLLGMLVMIPMVQTNQITFAEPKETQAEATTVQETEDIFATEMEVVEVVEQLEVLETQSTENASDANYEELPLFTINYPEEKRSDEEDTWIVTLTEEEFQDFCILVFAESGAECEEGQVAVAAVVLNRMENPDFPDTFYGVMTQPYQFSCVNNGYIYSSIQVFEDLPETTINAVKRALEGEDPTEELLWNEAIRAGVEDQAQYASGGALYFYNPRKCGNRKFTVQAEIGNHTFTKVWKR